MKVDIAWKKNLAWLFVITAGLLEIVWATGLKYEFIPPLIVLLAVILSFELFVRATKIIPIGTGYAAFVGIGTIGTVVVEAIIARGNFSWLKGSIILVLLLCMIGLRLSSEEEAH